MALLVAANEAAQSELSGVGDDLDNWHKGKKQGFERVQFLYSFHIFVFSDFELLTFYFVN
jgi:hypothetical protein